MPNDMMDLITALEERIAELEQQLAGLQNTGTVTFNRLACHELQIVSDTGESLITLNYDEYFHQGAIKILGENGKELCLISANAHGGLVAVNSAREREADALETGIEMRIDGNDNGHISVCGTDGQDCASLDVAPPHLGGAGRVAIYGTVDNRERVVIGCPPETDAGSVKTYSGIWRETHSIGNASGDLRVIAIPENNSDLAEYHHTLKQIDKKLENETDERQKRFLNLKKSLISQMISEAASSETS